jgi:hypothetical protein
MDSKIGQVKVAVVVELTLVVNKTFGTAFRKGTTVPPKVVPPRVVVIVYSFFDDEVGWEHLGVVCGSWKRFVRV